MPSRPHRSRPGRAASRRRRSRPGPGGPGPGGPGAGVPWPGVPCRSGSRPGGAASGVPVPVVPVPAAAVPGPPVPAWPGPGRPRPGRATWPGRARPGHPGPGRACPPRAPAGRSGNRSGSRWPGISWPGVSWRRIRRPVCPGRVSAGTSACWPVPVSPGAAVRCTWRGTSGCASGGCLPSSSPALGPGSRRCRPADCAVTEPFTAGGPGLVLPRDRDPPGRGRMYRRTRSISRSRISRTPSDRVPGCQGMTKLRERHLSLPAVTGYGCHPVTERLLLIH